LLSGSSQRNQNEIQFLNKGFVENQGIITHLKCSYLILQQDTPKVGILGLFWGKEKIWLQYKKDK